MNIRTNVQTIDEVRQSLEQMQLRGWQSYSPAWNCFSSGPSLGNGSMTGRYMTVIGMCLVSLHWQPGSTTTFGSGAFIFSLPIPCISEARVIGSARLYQSRPMAGTCLIEPDALSSVNLVAGDGSGTVDSAIPWTWANGDDLDFTILYPI